MEFLGDQGRDVTIIRDFLKNGNLFFIGPQTSVGNMYLGPYFYYLIAPSLLLSNFNPVGPAIFVALIGVATVALVFLISKKWFNLKTAYIASFLYAISPVAIKYSNFIWNPNIMPFFSLLFVYFFFESFKSKKYQYLIFASLAFVMVINSHYLGLCLLPFTGLFWLSNLIKFIKTKSKQLKPFLINSLIAILVFIISLTPQVLFDIKHDGQNIKAFLGFFSQKDTSISINPFASIINTPILFNQINTRLLAGKNETAGLIISIVFIIGLILIMLKKKNNKTSFYIPFFWYLSGLFCLILYKQFINDHYFTFLYPAVFILVGFLISKFKFIGIPLLLLITVFSLLNNPFRWPPNDQFGTTNKIGDLIINNSNNQDFNFALLAKQNYDPSYRYVLGSKQAKIVDIPVKLADQLFVVCEPSPQIDCNPVNNPEWAVAAFGWAKIDNQWEINGIKVFKLIHNLENKQ